MVKEGKELLAAYKEALFEGHNPDVPWAGRDAAGWAQFEEDLKPKQIKPKAPPPAKPTKAEKKAAKKK